MEKRLRDELERREKVKRLREEIAEILERPDDECDIDRIDAILAELDSIDPLVPPADKVKVEAEADTVGASPEGSTAAGLSGEELRGLMVDGELPEEHITKANLTALLGHECEQMWDAEFYDVSVIIYCTNLLIRNYASDEWLNWWSEAFKNVKSTVSSIDEEIKEAKTAFFLELLAAQHPDKANDEEYVKAATAKLRQYLDMGEPVLKEIMAVPFDKHAPKKKTPKTPGKRRGLGKLLKISAACIAILIGLQIAAVTTTGTTFFYLTRNTFMVMFGRTVQQDDLTRIALGTRSYGTIEELEAAENITILAPTWLPGDLEVRRTVATYDYSDGGRIEIFYNDGTSMLFIGLDSNIPNTEGAEIYEYNDISFYVFKDANLIWWEYESDFYSLELGFDITEYVEEIIESIKLN
jgi:hypothetical protein